MMWDGMAQGRVTGGVDGDDVGRNGKRACDWRADGTRMRRDGEQRRSAFAVCPVECAPYQIKLVLPLCSTW